MCLSGILGTTDEAPRGPDLPTALTEIIWSRIMLYSKGHSMGGSFFRIFFDINLI